METINPHIPKTVNAGEPVTAQAWNVIVNAIVSLTNYLGTTEGSSLKVKLTNTGLAASLARLTATRPDGITFEGVASVVPDGPFVFSGLKPGPYVIRAEAPGFDPATTNVTAPVAADVTLTLTARGAFMPLVFGATLPAALQQLQNAGIGVSRVLDVTGQDVPPANPSAEFANSLVLVQVPEPGTPVAPEGKAQLVVAASLRVEPTIEVPSFVGLTVVEAQKALEALGLTLGNVVTKQKSS
ncbi:MAG TPA: PASTA domain-containing protein [Pyrinomonadaceae bacterium]|nr:PASTA domain-containing protein [Pyrinomonadaceae bacterium]